MRETLNILALEPYFAGARRLMLESLQRRSRHKWNILRLPGRRIERRLEASAQWFAEVINRQGVAAAAGGEDADLVFTSEAINLTDLYNLTPDLGGKPAVVYFHENQLPVPGQATGRAVEHVNLLTAMDATEVWFNSLYHMRTFIGRATALATAHPELAGSDPLPRLTAKSFLVPSPVETDALSDLLAAPAESGTAGTAHDVAAVRRRMFIDLRGADFELLTAAIRLLTDRRQRIELFTIANGPGGRAFLDALPADIPRTILPEWDEDGQTFAMARCGTYLSAATGATSDVRAVMALASGMRVCLPDAGVYPELVPPRYHAGCLYDPRPQFLASALQDAWALPDLAGYGDEMREAMSTFDAASVVNTIDWRLSSLYAQCNPDPSDQTRG